MEINKSDESPVNLSNFSPSSPTGKEGAGDGFFCRSHIFVIFLQEVIM